MLGFDWSGIWGITRRDIIKYFRNKNQIITSLLMPTIFMVFMRQGFGSVAQNPFSTFNYANYIGAGIFCMTSVMGGLFLSGMPILFDKMMGFSDVLTVSPVDHKNIVFGFILAGTLKILFQGTIILCIAIFTGLYPIDNGLGIFGRILSIFPIYLILITGALSYASIGICIAARCDMQNSFLWTTIIQIPLVFISGAMFPVTGFPPIVAQIAALNPSTFLADGIRVFLGGTVGNAGTANLFGDIRIFGEFRLDNTSLYLGY
ncbi:MAG: ABC transporter permease, partial [Promethearchaeota archaeon]